MTRSQLLKPAPLKINVRDYGAVGDGITDDTAAIRAALDAAHGFAKDGHNVTVYLPAGEYIYKRDGKLERK